MPGPVRIRRLTREEGERLTALVRRGGGTPGGVRRATIILALSSGTPAAAIGRLGPRRMTPSATCLTGSTSEVACAGPSVGGRPTRLITDDDIAFVVVTTATTRPTTLDRIE